MGSEGEEKLPVDGDSARSNRLATLIQESRRSLVTAGSPTSQQTRRSSLFGFDEEEVTEAEENREKMQESVRRRLSVFEEQDTSRLVEVRLQNLSYHVPLRMGAPQVKTVMNQSICYGVYEFFYRMSLYCKNRKNRQESTRELGSGPRSHRASWLPRTASDVLNPFKSKPILNEINLVLKPGNTYLVLGPPVRPVKCFVILFRVAR